MKDLKEIARNHPIENAPFIVCNSKHEAIEFINFVHSKGYHWSFSCDGTTNWNNSYNLIYYCLTTANTIFFSLDDSMWKKEGFIDFSEFKTQFMRSEKIFKPSDDSVLYN